MLYVYRKVETQIGRLGHRTFHPGWYAYVGSAFGPGGLKARLGRHLRYEKSHRWHLDYLRPLATVKAVWVSYSTKRLEHQWAAALRHESLGGIAIAGFGASDCSCVSHLIYYPRRPLWRDLQKQLSYKQRPVYQIPLGYL